MNDTTDLTAEKLIAKATKIYSLPTIYTQINEAIDDPQCDIDTIAKILSEDSGISLRLLKIANSAMYNFPSKIESISRAITIIGTKQLRDLILATCVMGMFKDIPSNIVNMESFWRHNITVGIAARVIATYQRENNIERFYVMGLLHDIGRLIMFTTIPNMIENYLEESRENKVLLHTIESKYLGFDHADVGRHLIRGWRLPSSIEEAVGYHHKPSQAVDYKNEAAVIHLSDIIANALQFGSSGECYVPPLDENCYPISNIKASLMPEIINRIEQQYDDAVEIFLL